MTVKPVGRREGGGHGWPGGQDIREVGAEPVGQRPLRAVSRAVSIAGWELDQLVTEH